MRSRIARTVRGAVVLEVAIGAALVLMPPVAGATGELSFLGCFADAGANGCLDPPKDSLNGSSAVAVSPDGRNVYVASDSDDSVSSFVRNRFTGRLSFQGCIANNGLHGCVDPPHDSLDTAEGIAASPDGKSVYASAINGNSVTWFTRRSSDGAIAFAGCIANSGVNGCSDPPQDPLLTPVGITVSPDNRSVYVASAQGASITHLTRDPSTGAIDYQGCIANGGSFGCIDPPQDPLQLAASVAVSRDANDLYAAAYLGKSATHFSRDSNGIFLYEDCIADGGLNGCADPPVDSLNGAEAVAVSPSDRSVYVASGQADAVTGFTRNTTSGVLSFQGCYANAGGSGCVDPPHDSFNNSVGVAVSPDDRSAYVTSYTDHALTHLRRSADGALTYQGCVADAAQNGCVASPPQVLNGAWGVAVSPDNKSVYVAALNGVVEFVRHVADCAKRPATIVGTKGAETITGTPKADVIAGLGGADKIRGLGGGDSICGGAGKDRLRGGRGRDRLFGQGGADRLFGGPGRDQLRGGAGRDRLRQ